MTVGFYPAKSLERLQIPIDYEPPAGWSASDFLAWEGSLVDDYFDGNTVTFAYRDFYFYLTNDAYAGSGFTPGSITWIGPNNSGNLGYDGLTNTGTTGGAYFIDCPSSDSIISEYSYTRTRLRIPKTGTHVVSYKYIDNVTEIEHFVHLVFHAKMREEDDFPEVRVCFGNQIPVSGYDVGLGPAPPGGWEFLVDVTTPLELSGGEPVDRSEILWADLEEWHLNNGGPPKPGVNYSTVSAPCISICAKIAPQEQPFGSNIVPRFFFSKGVQGCRDWLETELYPYSLGSLTPPGVDDISDDWFLSGNRTVPTGPLGLGPLQASNLLKFNNQFFHYPYIVMNSAPGGVEIGNGWWQYAAIPIKPNLDDVMDPDEGAYEMRFHTYFQSLSSPYSTPASLNNKKQAPWSLFITPWDKIGKTFTLGSANQAPGWLIGMIPIFGVG